MKQLLKDIAYCFIRGFNFAFLVMIIQACATTTTTHVQKRDVEAYMRQFMRDMNKPLDDLDGFKIGFTNKMPSPSTIGACVPGFKTMIFRKDYWDNALPLTRKGIVYHEMAHCYCGLNIMRHEESWMNLYDCPKTLMNAYQPDYGCLSAFMDVYIDDLKDRCKRR